MLNVESIQNGVVIDHIPAGKGMDIYRLLELEVCSIAAIGEKPEIRLQGSDQD
mgnify:CR=1 FL=1